MKISTNGPSNIWTSLGKSVDFVGIRASKPFERALVQGEKMRDTKWFTGAKLNFAENLLRYRDDQVAIVFQGEDQVQRSISYKDLYVSVAKLAAALKSQGVQSGDRVAGFMPNKLETVVAMLATTSLGAVWSSCSPDFGIKGVLDRLGKYNPKCYLRQTATTITAKKMTL